MITCAACGAQNLLNTVFCEECGRSLADMPKCQASPETRSMLRIEIRGTERAIEAPYGQELLIGRRDGESNVLPAVDLTDQGALEHGVSRRHACITFEQGQPYISDLNSTNGTWLGPRFLAPYEIALLQDGDELTLGTLVLRVRFP